jgi:hypothetical protein
VELALADGALQAQQHPIIVLGRVVDPVQITQQRARHRAQFQQLMPFPA